MSKKLLTAHEVADRLSVPLRTAYDLLAVGGKLHHLRIELSPKVIRVDPDKLDAFLAAGGVANVDQ